MKSTFSDWQREALRDFCVRIQDDGALRAALKRAVDINSVVGLEAVIRLEERALAGSENARERDRMARLAILLAHRCVKRTSANDDPKAPIEGRPLAERFGEASGEQRLLSPLRFQRLIHGDDDDERLRQLRRALGLLSAESLHRQHLAEAWFQLTSPEGRRAFARNYFAPTPNTETTESTEVTP
ncbi:MAG: type I-E CRISPR-associated protein Cse2/CasB [Lysobacterales bacterium]